jgi:hypothetical protein
LVDVEAAGFKVVGVEDEMVHDLGDGFGVWGEK